MNVLIADESQDSLQMMERSLNEWGYSVYTANTANEVREKFFSIAVDIVIANRVMLDTNEGPLCQGMKDGKLERGLYVIGIIGNNSESNQDDVLREGLDDCITQPIAVDELKARIEIGVRIIKLEREAVRREAEIKKSYFQTLSMFTSMIEVFDEDLGGHCRRVSKLCVDVAKRHPAVSEDEYAIVEEAGLLHDIGMIGLPSTILSKKRTERNDDERQHYLTHPARGEIVLKEIEFLRPIAAIVRAHHEQFNGRGFPDGLGGDDIPVLARIVSAASIYDNFIYRGKVALEDMAGNLQRMRGYQLEPFVLDLLLETNLERLEKEAEKDFFGISLADLQAGMVIARDIRMKTGALAMPSGTELTVYGIEKLNSYARLQCIADKVFVYKSIV